MLKNINNNKQDSAKLSDIAEKIIAKPIEKTFSSTIIVGLAQLFEFIGLTSIGVAIYFYYVVDAPAGYYMAMVFAASALANVLFNISKIHSLSAYRSLFKQVGKVFISWSLVFIAILVVAFLSKASDNVSRIWLVSWYILGLVFLIGFRLFLKSVINKWTKNGNLNRRTVIVGGGDDAKQLILSLTKNTNSDIDLLGIFDERVDKRSPDEVAGVAKLGNVSDLVDFARRTQVDLIIVSLPLSAENRVIHMLSKLWVLPVDIRLSAHMSKLKFESHTYSYVGDVAVLDIEDKPISGWNQVFKWLFDKIVAVLLLILLAPVMLITAIAIKIDSRGSVFFKQQRHGFNNEVFNIYKFRSMYSDKLDLKAKEQVVKNDARVTPVGKFIRKTSIDELPQLFNVLKNELSIVGPRPHVMEGSVENKPYYETIDGYFARHKVKPGITGWAQVNGWRGGTDTINKIERRVEHDLYYIENWTLLFDLQILLMTPFSLISKNENAY